MAAQVRDIDNMQNRYTGGQGRRGERAEQLAVRARLIAVVRANLQAAPVPWYRLPKTLESWDVLKAA